MTRWMVYAQADRLFPGLEIDFVESPQIENKTTTNLAVGDQLTIDWAGGGGASGLVVEATKDTAVIEVDSIRYPIRKPTANEVINPILSKMHLIPWIVA